MKKKKILIMGLPGAGKTYLAKILKKIINADWINADQIRKQAKDWDFSSEGRLRQARRMKSLADKALKKNKHVIVDFVCPTPQTRNNFKADFLIWMDTIKKSRFKDTNQIFIRPKKYDFRITKKNAELSAIQIADKIQGYAWNNKNPTAQMLGRWQPWHEGHQKLFEEVLKKTGQVNIMVKDVCGLEDNPFNFNTVKKNILKALKNFKKRIKITLVPNITNVCFGRTVGYNVEEIVLDKKIQKISATKIRAKMRKEGKLKQLF
mgnify:CR=1 FL=1|jgi:adenylylsulfate kinase